MCSHAEMKARLLAATRGAPRSAQGPGAGPPRMAVQVALALALVGASGQAGAAVEFASGVSTAPDGRSSARSQEPDAHSGRLDASVHSARRGNRREPTLRCFQDGRLVYEGTGLIPVARTAGSHDFRSTRSRSVTVQVLDLRSGLCLVEGGDAP